MLDAQSLGLSTRFDSLDVQTQQILSSVLEISANNTSEHSKELHDTMRELTIAITQLLSRVESLNHDFVRRKRNIIMERLLRGSGIRFHSEQEVTAEVEMFAVSQIAEQQVRTSVNRKIIRSLSYYGMTNRYEDLVEAHPTTFEWAFHDPTEEQLPWDNLSEWYKTGQGVYWVSGKAGSGKSTFMKHVFDSPRTEEYLRTWAGDDILSIATFYFWNSGTREQKSQTGFLRALLFQVLCQYQELVPIVFPKVWAGCYSRSLAAELDTEEPEYRWSQKQLIDSLFILKNQTSIPIKICFLVDGLDEFDGDHEEIALLFKKLTSSSNLKICFSSRPWVVFEQMFSKSPKLRLQNLTYRDIERYTSDKLSRHEAFQRVAEKHSAEAPELVREIVEKAEGVFLWVQLVVQSLLKGIRNRDELSDLWERLRLLPRELEPLYNRLLELIEPMYFSWVSKALQIVHLNRTLGQDPFGEYSGKRFAKPLSLTLFFLAMNQDVDILSCQNPIWLTSKCKDAIIQLTGRCAGFLEVSKPRGGHIIGSKCLVHYFHRTARDFLETEACATKLSARNIDIGFSPSVALMGACCLALQIEPLMNELEKEVVVESKDVRPHLTALSNDFLTYAYHANTCKGNRKIRATILKFHTLMDRTTWKKGADWISILLTLNSQPYHGSTNFLDLATIYNLTDFVSWKLQQLSYSSQTADSIFRQATRLLYILLPPSTLYSRVWGLPLPTIEMVSLLLVSGADPNRCDDTYGSTYQAPWERTLLCVTNIELPSPVSSPTFEETDFPSGRLSSMMMAEENKQKTTALCRYIQIMEALLQGGADPNYHILVGTKLVCALDIINGFLSEQVPCELIPLLFKVKRALIASKPFGGDEKLKNESKSRRKGEEVANGKNDA
jgi:hypothetical protein